MKLSRTGGSPNVCLIERRVNAMGLYDASRDMAARAVTFEGNEHDSHSAPLTGTIITEQIQRACNAIVDHVAEVSSMKHRISRMVAHFRMDAEGKLWFLWQGRPQAPGPGHRPPRHPTQLQPSFLHLNGSL